MANYDSLSIEQLEAELTRLHNEQKRIGAEKKAVAAALDHKLIERSANEKLAAMSPAEREALLQALQSA